MSVEVVPSKFGSTEIAARFQFRPGVVVTNEEDPVEFDDRVLLEIAVNAPVQTPREQAGTRIKPPANYDYDGGRGIITSVGISAGTSPISVIINATTS